MRGQTNGSTGAKKKYFVEVQTELATGAIGLALLSLHMNFMHVNNTPKRK